MVIHIYGIGWKCSDGTIFPEKYYALLYEAKKTGILPGKLVIYA